MEEMLSYTLNAVGDAQLHTEVLYRYAKFVNLYYIMGSQLWPLKSTLLQS